MLISLVGHFNLFMSRRFFLICMVAMVVSLTGCRSGKTGPTTSQPLSSAEERKQQQAYEATVSELFAPYWDSPQSVDAAALKQQLLDVAVPRAYLDLHLKLVVAVTAVAQGDEAADQQLRDLQRQYSWLK
jgi:hypothetical protein